MSRRFRIGAIPTLASAVGVGLLLTLGTWQANRYSEKLAIEKTQAQSATLAPQPISHATQLADDDVDYRRVDAHGSVLTDYSVLFKFRILDGKSGMWLAAPLRLADGNIVLLLRGWVDIKEAESVARSQKLPDSGIYRGIVYRLARNIIDDDTRAALPTSPSKSYVAWNTFDVAGVYRFWNLPHIDPSLVIVQTEGDEGPPIESADFMLHPYMNSDRHLGYALTWYSLAVALFGMWLAAGFGFIGSPRPSPARPQKTS